MMEFGLGGNRLRGMQVGLKFHNRYKIYGFFLIFI